MFRTFRTSFALALALTVGLATYASAQGQAEFKRELKAGMVLYKEPGLMEVAIKSMKDEMMLTGNVATAEQSAKAEEIIKGVRGVKKVRNRLRVGNVEDCSKATDAELMKKIEEQIGNDEELTQARRKFELVMQGPEPDRDGRAQGLRAGGLADQPDQARALPELAGLREARVLIAPSEIQRGAASRRAAAPFHLEAV